MAGELTVLRSLMGNLEHQIAAMKADNNADVGRLEGLSHELAKSQSIIL